MITRAGKKLIIEVKGDHQIEDEIVQAKSDYATSMAELDDMEYHIVKSSEYTD